MGALEMETLNEWHGNTNWIIFRYFIWRFQFIIEIEGTRNNPILARTEHPESGWGWPDLYQNEIYWIVAFVFLGKKSAHYIILNIVRQLLQSVHTAFVRPPDPRPMCKFSLFDELWMEDLETTKYSFTAFAKFWIWKLRHAFYGGVFTGIVCYSLVHPKSLTNKSDKNIGNLAQLKCVIYEFDKSVYYVWMRYSK